MPELPPNRAPSNPLNAAHMHTFFYRLSRMFACHIAHYFQIGFVSRAESELSRLFGESI
jgi:hypothetical protein